LQTAAGTPKKAQKLSGEKEYFKKF